MHFNATQPQACIRIQTLLHLTNLFGIIEMIQDGYLITRLNTPFTTMNKGKG